MTWKNVGNFTDDIVECIVYTLKPNTLYTPRVVNGKAKIYYSWFFFFVYRHHHITFSHFTIAHTFTLYKYNFNATWHRRIPWEIFFYLHFFLLQSAMNGKVARHKKFLDSLHVQTFRILKRQFKMLANFISFH